MTLALDTFSPREEEPRDDTSHEVLVLPFARHHSLYTRVAKPILDRAVALVLLLMSLPLLVACALAIRASLGPGVIYRQDRVGLGGRPFTILKFRTMHHDRRRGTSARSYAGPERRHTHKSDDDPRHTPLGRFLRKWSLDELPQLWNVARGNMSLVGPRPELCEVVARYAPWQHRRHHVRPGLTGLWQVSRRGQGDGCMHEEDTLLDLEYVRRVSLWVDVKILLSTVPAVLFRSGR